MTKNASLNVTTNPSRALFRSSRATPDADADADADVEIGFGDVASFRWRWNGVTARCASRPTADSRFPAATYTNVDFERVMKEDAANVCSTTGEAISRLLVYRVPPGTWRDPDSISEMGKPIMNDEEKSWLEREMGGVNLCCPEVCLDTNNYKAGPIVCSHNTY